MASLTGTSKILKTKTSLILEYLQTKEDSRRLSKQTNSEWPYCLNLFYSFILPVILVFIILKSSEFLVQCEWQFYFIFISSLITTQYNMKLMSSSVHGCCIGTVSVSYLNFLLMVLTQNNMLFVCCSIKFEAWSYMLVC